MIERKKNISHPWYKKKNYLHFDLALNLEQAEAYVTNPENIVSHRFSPLIHYKKVSAKVSSALLHENGAPRKAPSNVVPLLEEAPPCYP